MISFKNAIVATFACAVIPHSAAGMPEGTHLVWFNLSENAAVDKRIARHVSQGPAPECWESGSLLFMRDKPKAITRSLVMKAVVHRDKKAMIELDRVLRRPYKDATSGFDGIVVYSEGKQAILSSMAARGRKINSAIVHHEKHPQYLEELFCGIAPPISRPS